MKGIKWYLGLGLSVVTSFLLLLSFPTYNIHFLAFFALIPIFIVTYVENTKKTPHPRILHGTLQPELPAVSHTSYHCIRS